MGWVTDWETLHEEYAKPVAIDEFAPMIRAVSEWMDEAECPDMIMNVVRSVMGSDTDRPIVVGHHGEVIDGLPQLLKAYIDGVQVISVVRLSSDDYFH